MDRTSTKPGHDRPRSQEHVGTRCFKCAGRLRPYRRSGLLVEQCEDCRGIFLDGGELERLIEAEGGGWSGRVGPPWSSDAVTRDGEPMSAGQAAAPTH